MERTCFVISPIGKEGTDIRKDADEFLDYLVEPALEKYAFDVIRADQIPQPNVITADIIRLVRESDLCIIDITNSNPNVFYECGRRHETGRPFIQMVRVKQTSEIPFDVAGIRTIEYDLSNTAAARKSVKRLQAFIDEFEREDFGDRAAGYTLASIGDAIDRMERKVNRLITEHKDGEAKSADDQLSKIEILTSHPKRAFTSLLEASDLTGAYTLLERVRSASGVDEFLRSAGLLARAGYQPSKELLVDFALEMTKQESPDPNTFHSVAYSIKEHYTNIGRMKDGITQIKALFVAAKDCGKFDNNGLALISNIVGMIAWDCREHDVGKEYAEITVTLNSSVPDYWSNKALRHDLLHEEKELHDTLRSLSNCSDLKESHLQLLAKHGFEAKSPK